MRSLTGPQPQTARDAPGDLRFKTKFQLAEARNVAVPEA